MNQIVCCFYLYVFKRTCRERIFFSQCNILKTVFKSIFYKPNNYCSTILFVVFIYMFSKEHAEKRLFTLLSLPFTLYPLPCYLNPLPCYLNPLPFTRPHVNTTVVNNNLDICREGIDIEIWVGYCIIGHLDKHASLRSARGP